MMPANNFKKKIALIACFSVVLFLVIAAKVYFSSRGEFRLAEGALSNGEYREAITHYERAILWYLPIGGFVDASAQGLWDIGVMFEEEDKKLSLETYRTLRSSFYATRSFYTPGEQWIDRTNKKIALLMAQEPPYSEEDKKKSVEQRRKEALAILERPMKPNPAWSIILEIGFWGWVSGTFLFIFRSFGPDYKIIPRQGIFWGGVVILFYAMWIIGMMKA